MEDLTSDYLGKSALFKGYLEELAVQSGLRHTELAEKLGVTRSVYYRWLRADQHDLVIPLSSLKGLMQLAGIDVHTGLDPRSTLLYGAYLKLRLLRESLLGAPGSRPVNDTLELLSHLREAERRATVQKG